MGVRIYIHDLRTGKKANVTDSCIDCECYTWDGELVTYANLTVDNASCLLDAAQGIAQSYFGHNDVDCTIED